MDLKALMGSDGIFEQSGSTQSHSPSPCQEEELEYVEPLTKRLNQFRQNGVGCDVVFIVGDEHEQVNAHRLVLACSSAVFYAMFYGPASENAKAVRKFQSPPPTKQHEEHDSDSLDSLSSSEDCSSDIGSDDEDDEDFTTVLKTLPPGIQVVRVPDCSGSAFNNLINYIYSNFDFSSIKLRDENVMQTLYAAKKYDIRSLVTACIRYLLNGLAPTNAICLLAQARLFQEEMLMQRCHEMIDKHTDIALQSESVTEVDRNTLMEVLGRSQLDPSSELVVFHAARSWAESECARLKIPPTVDNLRATLGPAMKLIRFPRLSVNEFGVAASSALLTCEEIAEVFLHLTVKPQPHCRYPTGFRFTADRDILVRGLGVYGLVPVVKPHIGYIDDKTNAMWSAQVEIQLASVTDPHTYGSTTCSSATNTVHLQGNINDPTPIVAYFTEPVPCAANITYVASIRFLGENAVQTFAGKDGQESVTIELPFDEAVTFKFQSYRNAYGNDDGGKIEGQIPSLHFLVHWPEN
uniref:BTB domain-containing protein n=2 Tax=Acrobeloides nanus TaxID=290746 RepID=A0A914CQH1_9BILA